MLPILLFDEETHYNTNRRRRDA